jgi:hypothetical protein
MRSISKLSIVGLALGLFAGGTAFAGDNHGTQCNPEPQDVADVAYSQFGVHNTSLASAANVHCGGAKGFNLFSNMSATVYDRSPTSDVCCTMQLTNADGTVFFSANRCTTGFASTPMALNAAMPPAAGYVHMRCSLPPRNAATGVSHLTTFDTP